MLLAKQYLKFLRAPYMAGCIGLVKSIVSNPIPNRVMHMQGHDQQTARHQRRIAGLRNERKLTWGHVNEIRQRYVAYSRVSGLKALAEEYGVSVNNIHKIVRGKTWKVTEGDGNVPPPLADKITAQAFAKSLGQYGQRMIALRTELNRLV